jgi:hypothetical protein
VTKAHAESGPQNTGPTSGPKHFPELDQKARINAQLLPPVAAVLEVDRHQYPSKVERVHKGMTPTGSLGGGHLHDHP